MGEFFDLYEAGILDEMGEFTGHEGDNYQSRRQRNIEIQRRNAKVRLLMKERGLTTPKAQKRALKKYGLEVKTDRPTYHACQNWATFKFFINKRVGYTAPSKRAKDASKN